MEQTTDPDQARVLMNEATMIQRANLESVHEEFDRAAVEGRFSAVASAYTRLSDLAESYPQPQHQLQLAADSDRT
jgi:hypothetical protein